MKLTPVQLSEIFGSKKKRGYEAGAHNEDLPEALKKIGGETKKLSDMSPEQQAIIKRLKGGK